MTERTPDQLDAWVIAYLDGTQDAEAFAQLSETLRNDPAALDRFVELASLDRALLDTLTHSEQVQAMQQVNLQQTDASLSFEDRLALLNRGSESAELVHVHGELKPHQRWMPYFVGGAIAAVLVLAVTLTFVFTGEPNQSKQGPELTNRLVPTSETAVATLTNTHNTAQWTDGDLISGSKLLPGQRLVLTHGIAEITTEEGAVVILEAPTTIELLNNNALRLHTGRLVGVCETESSKGLLVRTPHMDVTDLGTRFGIDADSRATEVHVLDGEVELLRPDTAVGVEPIVLVRGQSAGTSADSKTIAAIDHDVDRFIALMPEAIRSDVATNWQIVAINGEPLETPGAMRIAKRVKGSPWITAEQSYAQQVNDETTFTVQTRFELPQNVDGASAALLLQFDANDRVSQVRLNGRAYTPPTNSRDDGHAGMHAMRIDGALLAGQNTLQLDVVDVRRAGAHKWELRVDWSIETVQNQATQPGGQGP